MMILSIAERELKNLFISPLAWSILGVIQFILAYLFLTQIDAFHAIQPRLAATPGAPGLTDITVIPLFGSAAVICLLITPLLTMRLICEERRNNTLTLLLSAPVSNSEIIFGKYLGVMGFLLIITVSISIMPLSLLIGGTLDMGKFAANILALVLLLASFAAIGLYMSCIASHPTVAAMGSLGVLLLLWILDRSAIMQNPGAELFEYLSILKHFQNLQSGLVDTMDISYFLLFTALFLILSIRRLENDRLQK